MSDTTATQRTNLAKRASYVVADLFLEALAKAGVDYLFAVLGSDHPSIIEAYVRRQNEGKVYPKMLLFQHEFVAMSAADGYGRITGKPQCVIVHVDVGTAALGQGLHNASSGRAPVLIFAGQAPFTLYGELAGSRSEHVQWYQDVHGQGSILAPYSRYTNEIKSGTHVSMMVNRALLMASTGSPGPSYLTATREVLASTAEPTSPVREPLPFPTCHLGGIPETAVELIGKALLNAERPLVVTGYLGRNHQAVENLVKLADLIPIRVFDSEQREMSFPANHRAWLTRSTGAGPAIKKADVIVVLDADVPWIPTKLKPSDSATIFHIDVDPRKERMTLFDIYATETYNADSATALSQLHAYISSSPDLSAKQETFLQRWTDMENAYQSGLSELAVRSNPPASGSLTKDFLFKTMRASLPENAVILGDAVTNSGPMSEQLQRTIPGTNFTKGSSGLGWAGGAAIGMKLATDMHDTSRRPILPRKRADDENTTGNSRLICAVLGDGSWMFSVPSSVYWAAYRHSTPFLTIVLNNGGWKATRYCVNDVHPDGLAAQVSDQGLGIDLRGDQPDYAGIAKAASGGRLWTRTIDRCDEAEAALAEAIKAVEEGKGALIEAII